MNPRLLLLLVIATIAPMAGCSKCEPPRPPKPDVNYYLSSGDELEDVGSVVMIELMQESGPPGAAASLTQALATAIRQQRLFNLEVLGSNEDIYRLIPVGRHFEPLTLRQLADIRNRLNCDAVLIGVVSNYQTFPHTQLSLRLRLVDLRKGQLLWAVDNVWQAGDRAMEDRMEAYYYDYLARDYQPLDWRLALLSPKAFNSFVAFETAQTLQTEPPQPDAAKSCVKKIRKVRNTVDYLSHAP